MEFTKNNKYDCSLMVSQTTLITILKRDSLDCQALMYSEGFAMSVAVRMAMLRRESRRDICRTSVFIFGMRRKDNPYQPLLSEVTHFLERCSGFGCCLKYKKGERLLR